MPDSAHEPASPPAHVRLGGAADTDVVARMFFELWPDGPLAEHTAEAALILTGSPPSTMPLVVFVAEADVTVVGFIEVGLRSPADGCDTRQHALRKRAFTMREMNVNNGLKHALWQREDVGTMAAG